MADHEALPIDRAAQARTERRWLLAARDGRVAEDVRHPIRDSWSRSVTAGVRPDLDVAPIALDTDALAVARDRCDWLPLVDEALARMPHGVAEGHVLAVFDAAGRMLAEAGDPAALDGLSAINFRPGALWTEAAVGTNGPGTALAAGRAVHVVGAEHFCATWQRWHCAAVPVRDPATGVPIGVLDLSGFRDRAHPHALDAVIALALAVEQMLAARDGARRFRVMTRMTELLSRHPHAPLVAVDRLGQVLAASPAAPPGLRPDSRVPERLRAAMEAAVSAAGDQAPAATPLVLHEELAILTERHAVLDGRVPVGACFLLLDGGAPTMPGIPTHLARIAAPPPPAPVPSPPRPRAQVGATTRYTFGDLIGASPALARATRLAAAAAGNALPVLLLGESGTGKEVFAQAIHAAGPRADRPFVAVNCAAIPHALVESELFGYVGGAFSGARREGSAGKFEAAHGGTLLLDEIGELPASAQAALLRVLQEGELTRVGGVRGVPVNVRVIAATNRELARDMAAGRFRRDLFHRLDVLSVQLPALRERPEDVPALAQHFLALACAEQRRPPLALADEVLDAFHRHPWPGNVRELKNLVNRLAALVDGTVVRLDDLPPGFGTSRADAGVVPWDAYQRDLELDERPASRAWRGAPPPARAGDDAARAHTLDVVRAARTMGDAARTLGITRSTLYRRLERYGVHLTRGIAED